MSCREDPLRENRNGIIVEGAVTPATGMSEIG